MAAQASEKSLRKALGRLVSGGADAVWLPAVQPLLALPATQEKLAELGEDRVPEALRAVLLDAIGELGPSQYRILLTIVLGLEPRYAKLSAAEKRAIAGREFRGGKRAVTAGTIRQHHEPRALDELASILLSSAQVADRPTAFELALAEGGERGFAFHPAARVAWGSERLSFWRLSLSEFDPAAAAVQAREAIARAGVRSWVMYQLLGPFDVLLRVWLPAETSTMDFEQALHAAFRGNLTLSDYFLADEIIAHWPWRGRAGEMRVPPPEALSSSPPSRELERLLGGDRSLTAHYRKLNIVADVREEAGIGVLVAIARRTHPLSPFVEREAVKDAVLRVLDEAPQAVLSERSLYRGSGFAEYLLQGRVRYDAFHEFGGSVLDPLNSGLKSLDLKTQTLVLATPRAAIRGEEPPRGRGDAGAEEVPARELLEREEGPTLEVLGSAFTDLGRERPSWDGSAGVTQGLLRAVTAFLNSNGGTVVVGAYDKGAIQGLPEKAVQRMGLAGAPEVGRYAVRGIDRESEGDVDRIQARLTRLIARSIEPDCSMLVQIRSERIGDRTVWAIDVAPGAEGWFYYKRARGAPQFLVRQGSETVALAGSEADRYKTQKAGAEASR
jgi:Putative DNA-binding domain